jgi:predicted RNase H-like nuclease (RuvC/YqgF family)
MTLLIIGVDPGTTLGYAIISEKGEFITSGSGKDFGMSELINNIISFGRPLVVGCDKNPPPWFAESLAVKLGAKLFYPRQDLLVSEKRELVKDYNVRLNAHEVDALSSAVFALGKHRNFFAKIDRFLENENKQGLGEAVKMIMIRNDQLPLGAALSMAEQKDKEKIIETPKQVVKATEKSAFSEKMLREMQEKIILLEEQNRSMIRLINEKDGLLRKLSKRVLSAPKEEIVDYKENRIKHYAKQLKEHTRLVGHYEKELRRINEFIASIGNDLLTKKLRDFGQEEFAAKKFLSISQGDILFVQNPSNFSQKVIDELKGKVKVIVTSNVPKKWEPGFVFIKPEGIIIRESNNFAIADKKALEEALRKKDLLKNIVDEYRRERVKEE